MMTGLNKMPKPNIVFDASQLDLYQVCPCRFNYRYNLNKSLPGKAAPLDRGGLMHEALEAYYRSLKDKMKYNEAVDEMLKRYDIALIESDLDSDKLDNIRKTLLEYAEYWRVYDQQFEIVDIERPFIYLLKETDDAKIYMAGKIDLVVSDNKYMNLPYDHKSFERSRETQRLNNQFINYCNSVESNYLFVNKIGLQKTLAPDVRFKRVPLSYDPLYIEQWKANTVKWIEQYLINVAEGVWPMNLTSCDKYNRQCEYYEVCDTSGLENKAYKLEANYTTTEPWDVSAILEGKKREHEN